MNRKWSRRLFVAAAAAGVATLALPPARRKWPKEHAPAGDGIRFIDLTGEEVILPGPARRIVDLWTVGGAFAIAAHGTAARLVAVNGRAHSIFKRGLIGRIHPEVLDLPYDVLAGNGLPNVERLVSLNPDLVVDFKHDARSSATAMKNAGLRVARYAGLDGGLTETIAGLLRMYGEMIGSTARARRIVSVMHEVTASLIPLQPIPYSARPRVLQLMQIGGRIHASGGGAGGLYSDYMYMAGGVNAAENLPGISIVSAEQIAALNPDVVLVFQSEGASTALIHDHPVLKNSAVAATRRVYVLPIGANNWGSMGPDEFLSPLWLAALLYPERFDGIALRRDMLRAYEAIFDRTLSDTELNGILRHDLNEASSGYSRLRL